MVVCAWIGLGGTSASVVQMPVKCSAVFINDGDGLPMRYLLAIFLVQVPSFPPSLPLPLAGSTVSILSNSCIT